MSTSQLHQITAHATSSTLNKRLATVMVAAAAFGILPVGIAAATTPAAAHPVAAVSTQDIGRDIPRDDDDRTRDRQRDQRQERRSENIEPAPFAWTIIPM
ncbi:hypothetical protein [Rhodococcus jostii]|uniref:Uncharacterized protein n=1 Tax=Rhodococcus jostii TaxID=132919 RepID=A0A1H5CWJ8_RHOJO|nr:hypothetical protein [Rhodococcus jostii]SED71062.1 hypothetical protein SAMN04490220_5288 [Rhodococcus jostii]